MSFKKVIKGGTLGPGYVGEPFTYYEGVTFLAQCIIKEGSMIIGGKFERCCPKPYSNQNSKVEKSIIKDTTLEYVETDADTRLFNIKNTNNRVVVQGPIDPNPIARGSETNLCVCYCSDPCYEGVILAPGATQKDTFTTPCEPVKLLGFGDSNKCVSGATPK